MTPEERNDHPLIKVLQSRNGSLADQAARLIERSERLLEYTQSTFHGGTDHTARHTRTVERIARMVLSDEFLAAMSSEEIFFLAVACHYHDLAMAGTEADDQSAEAREQVRRDHAIRIGAIIHKQWAELGFESPRWAEVLGEVCRGHRPKRNAEGETNWDELSQNVVLGPGVMLRVRLVAALIYAIDELHLGADRAPERVQNWRNIQHEESRRHWRRHQAVHGPALKLPASLVFDVSSNTPDFEENLRSQVFRKAFSAMRDLRRQAAAEGITAALPVITIQWQRHTMWALLFPIACSDMQPRSRGEVVRAILGHSRQYVESRISLDGICAELGNSDAELEASASRAVDDAVVSGHLVAAVSPTGGYVLSDLAVHGDSFFKAARDADETDRLFVGRYHHSWEQELFASEFGRGYVRCTVFPAVERSYSVRLAQRPPTDPVRLLIESCPTAARMVQDQGPAVSNLVKDVLLAQVTTAGALIDCHTDAERLLDSALRTAIRELTGSNAALGPTVRLLEELALLGGFNYEQLSAAAVPSEAARVAMEEQNPAQGNVISIRVTQAMPSGAAGTTHLHRLLLASRRAGTPIRLAASADHDLTVRVEGDAELASRAAEITMVGIGPPEARQPASFRLPARVEVSRPTRTIRFWLGRFSANAPTASPVVMTLPVPADPTRESTVTCSSSIQWPELTVGDWRALEAANQVIRSSSARIELIIEDGNRQLGVMNNPRGIVLFPLWVGPENVQRALRGLERELPAPVLLNPDALVEIADLEQHARDARWQAERDYLSDPQRSVSSIYLRLTRADGCPTDERFLRFLPFNIFRSPTVETIDTAAAEEFRRLWDEAETDITLTSYYRTDMHDLSTALLNWCRNPREEFPFRFHGGGPPDPVTRSVLTVRLLERRDRIWYRDRPIIFEFRPTNRREAYQMEAEYWHATRDERRGQLAQEICDREPAQLPAPGRNPPAAPSDGPSSS